MLLSRSSRILLAAAALTFTVVGRAGSRVELVDRQGTRLDLENLHFVDESAQSVALSRYFHSGRPVVLALIYFACPRACTVLLNNFVGGLNRLGPTSGVDFDVLAVSIDPNDTPTLALAKKAAYLNLYARTLTQPAAAGGWHFLTGKEADIARLSEAVGFYYSKDESSGLINHPSALFFLTADGVLAKTLPGLNYSKRDLVAALYQTSHGVVNGLFSRLGAICNSYLPLLPLWWIGIFAGAAFCFLLLFIYSLIGSFELGTGRQRAPGG